MRSRLGRLLLILTLTVPVLAGRADAAPSDCTIFWTNAVGNGTWSNAGNWSSTADGGGATGAPGTTDVVCAATTTNGPFLQISGAIDVTVRGVELPASTSLIVVSQSTLTLSDPTAPATFGDLTIHAADATLTSAAPIVVLGTTGLHGPVQGDLTTNGLRGGAGGSVDGDLTFTDGGLSVFYVDQPYNNGNLTVSGTLTLAGDLVATASNGYVPSYGASFDLITAADIQGAFNGQFAYKKFGNGFIDDEFTATKVKAVVKPLPVFTIGSAPDVSESGGTATVTVERANPMDRDVKVNYATVDDTALAGTDYTSRSGTLTFAPGETTKSFTVPIIDDREIGPDVGFKVHLSKPVNGIIGDATNDRAVLITNDDLADPSSCTIFWTNAVGNGTWSNAGNWSSTADGSGATGAPGASDVVCAATTTNGPFLQLSGAIDATVRGVDLPTSTSLIVVSGSSLTLSDDAAPATFGDLTVHAADATLTSARAITVLGTTVLRGTMVGDLTTKNLQAGPSTLDGDLTLDPDGQSTFLVDLPYAAGTLTVTGTANLGGNLVAGASNSYSPAPASYDLITAGNLVGSFRGDYAYKKVGNWFIDDEFTATTVRAVVKPLPIITIGDAPDVTESDGFATIRVERANPMDRDVKVNYATVADTAVAGTDYTSTSGTLTFAPGETSKTFTVPIIDDSDTSPDVAFTVHLSSPVNGIIADETNDRRVQIYNDDPPVIESIEGGPVRQGSTNQLLTLHGLGLATTTDIVFARAGLTVVNGTLNVVDDSTVKMRVSAKSGMRTGPIGTHLYADAGEATCADCLSVVSRPSAKAMTPGVIGAGALRRTVTVTGTGFVDGAAVTIAGAAVHATEFVSSTELRVTLSVPSTRTPGPVSLRVTNADGGFSVCTTCASFVAAPTFDGDGLAARRASTQTIHLTGTGFVDGLTVTGPTGVTFTDLVVTPTEITATMAVSGTTRTATGQKVTVTNPASAGWGTVVGSILTVCAKTAPACGP